MNRKNKKINEGFTLIETVISVAIFAISMIAVSWSVISFYRANAYALQQAGAINSARRGVETMTREIREATYSDNGDYPLAQIGDFDLVFYGDIDKDTNIEKVRYFLDGTNFKRGEIQATGNPLVYLSQNEKISILSDSVRNTVDQPIFSYYDSDGVEVVNQSDILDVVLVKNNLIVNVVENRRPEEFTLRSTIQIRNLKVNL